MPVSIGLPIVSTCSVDTCGFNHDANCHAGAINVSATADGTHCVTATHTDTPAGREALAAVGACSRTDCKFNDAMVCNATEIQVGADFDTAHCLTFATA
ncbi:DUF1540 domain-containing protein [Demequina sp.]|uniref:DUF1540 domain-containing protein n=1 Tax=Demequina sp. TaxID=2050685 RepID=UPI003D13A4FE